MWETSWDNFVLYMAVIPGYSDDEAVDCGGDKIEVKDIWEVF